MINADTIVTTSDKLVGEGNNYITTKEIFDPELIVRAECFEIPNEKYFFVDFVFYLNRRYRRRLAFGGLTAAKYGFKTKIFKRVTGVFSELEELGVTEITFFTGKGVKKRIAELNEHE